MLNVLDSSGFWFQRDPASFVYWAFIAFLVYARNCYYHQVKGYINKDFTSACKTIYLCVEFFLQCNGHVMILFMEFCWFYWNVSALFMDFKPAAISVSKVRKTGRNIQPNMWVLQSQVEFGDIPLYLLFDV